MAATINKDMIIADMLKIDPALQQFLWHQECTASDVLLHRERHWMKRLWFMA